MAESFITKRLSGKDADSAREAMERLRKAAAAKDLDPRVMKIVAFAIIGGVIGAALPGHLGFPGMMVGLFIALRNWKKT